MINTSDVGQALKHLGYTFYTGVPCSFLKDLINYAINECDYVMAANEGDAVAIAAGASLGGKKSIVLMQNSGLTNATSPLTSLNPIFKIPVLGFVSLRGEEGIPDEPQHQMMGKITTSMLDLLNIHWEYLVPDSETAIKQIRRANEFIEKNESFFFVVKKDTFCKETLKEGFKIQDRDKTIREGKNDRLVTELNRSDVLRCVVSFKTKQTVLLATTGYTGRELYHIADAENHFYMVGSMGCISSLALGLAYSRSDKEVIAIDGDGSLLMRMGSLATNGFYAPKNMLHLLLDNQAHESTGGQETVSKSTNFAEIAAASGYPVVSTVRSIEELEARLMQWRRNHQLTFLHVKIKTGAPPSLGRPTISPKAVKERLLNYLHG